MANGVCRLGAVTIALVGQLRCRDESVEIWGQGVYKVNYHTIILQAKLRLICVIDHS